MPDLNEPKNLAPLQMSDLAVGSEFTLAQVYNIFGEHGGRGIDIPVGTVGKIVECDETGIVVDFGENFGEFDIESEDVAGLIVESNE